MIGEAKVMDMLLEVVGARSAAGGSGLKEEVLRRRLLLYAAQLLRGQSKLEECYSQPQVFLPRMTEEEAARVEAADPLRRGAPFLSSKISSGRHQPSESNRDSAPVRSRRRIRIGWRGEEGPIGLGGVSG